MNDDARNRRSGFGDERGGTFVLMVVALAALFGMMALAVDLGMGYTAKSEAQRVADASALAGGSAFLESMPVDAVTTAEERALDYATRNTVRNVPVDPSEVTIEVLTDERKIRVWIERQGLGTWFARVIGFDEMSVMAYAAAQATEAGAARCLKPFALPDAWFDADDDDNGNRVWDDGEEWVLNSDPGDRYQRYEGPGGPADATGYGSEMRGADRDFGRSLTIKPSDPKSEYGPSPGVFLPWRLPPDDDDETCDSGGGGGGQSAGAATYRNNICTCNQSTIELQTEYEIQPGNMIGPTNQGIQELLSEDPDARWDPSKNDGRGGIENSAFGADGLASPRVIKLALFDPTELDGSGMQTIRFNNFALLFLEDQPTRRDPIQARFMYYATGDESGSSGSLVLDLRLVE